MKAYADALIRLLTRSPGGKWPLPTERKIAQQIRTWQAFRESDRDALKEVCGWPKSGREYHLDPLAERIATAWATYLWGADPTFTAAAEADQQKLDDIVEASELPAELYRGEDICVSEGETWWRIYADVDLSFHPMVEFHSRLSVVPLWVGPRRLGAVAIVTQLEGGGRGGNKESRWRHFEIHTDGRVENVLFRGTKDTLGQLVDLNLHPETNGLAPVWEHGLPGKLAGRIPNKLGRDPRVGTSDYAGIKDYLLDLNEATTIGAENARLTAKKRVIVPQSALQRRPTGGLPEGQFTAGADAGDGSIIRRAATFDAGEDVLVADPLDREMGRESKPFQVLEYSFDAEALITYKRDLVETALTRIGITPQWVGVRGDGGEGYAATGTALRLRLVPTSAAGGAKARPWEVVRPILQLCALLDGMPAERGGFDRKWSEAEPPAVERGDALPEDPLEEATRHQVLLGAGAESARSAIEDLHPDWDTTRVDAEIEAIRGDRQASAPTFSLPGGE